MEFYQLKTFVAVAREGSITRASEQLHLSQPAVSAHIKALEDTLGLSLFERTPRGMSLTPEGNRLLVKVEQMLAAHQQMMEEAARIKGRVGGKLRLGACGSLKNEVIGHLLRTLAERHPEVEVTLKHGTSADILVGLRNGSLDAGYYNEATEPDPELAAKEVSRFKVYLAASPGLVPTSRPLDWQALASLPWIYPTSSACCAKAAESLFQTHHIRPERVISVDRESLTQTLIASGIGVGLLHEHSAESARARGEVELLALSPKTVRVFFAHLKARAEDPLLSVIASIVGDGPSA
jgi:DNA-binding transcriptional LysR family regulator